MKYVVYINISGRSDGVFAHKAGSVGPRSASGRYITNNWYVSDFGRFDPVKHTVEGYYVSPRDSFYATDVKLKLAVPPLAKNKLYSKVIDAINSPKGELMTSLYEWRTSLDMITKRVTSIGRAYLALRRFDLPTVASELLMTPKERTRAEKRVQKRFGLTARELRTLRRPKGFKKKAQVGRNRLIRPSEAWLEYWMGWAPLHGDIAGAVSTLEGPLIKSSKINEGVKISDDFRRETGNPSDPLGGSGYSSRHVTLDGYLGFYCDVMVTNPHLLLATQLGFINPALTAWQVVPFSFIVDWFANIGKFLGSFTDTAGLTLSNSGYAYRYKTKGQIHGFKDAWTGAKGYRRFYQVQNAFFDTKARNPGPLTRPILTMKLPKLSPTRAATSISLILELFKFK